MIKKKLGREMEVVGRAEALLVAEELDELGVEIMIAPKGSGD